MRRLNAPPVPLFRHILEFKSIGGEGILVGELFWLCKGTLADVRQAKRYHGRCLSRCPILTITSYGQKKKRPCAQHANVLAGLSGHPPSYEARRGDDRGRTIEVGQQPRSYPKW